MGQPEFLSDGLTEEQAAIFQAVLAHKTMQGTATALGLSRSTLYRKLEEPELIEALRRARAQMLEQAITQLQQEAGEAVATLGAVLRDNRASAAARVRAAEAILEYALRGSELLDIAGQLAELRSIYAEIHEVKS